MAMRNDNQQTKKKFRLPLFDIALLLLLAIAVAGGSYWVSRRGDKETVTVQYTIRFENVDNAYSGAVTQAEELFSVSGTRMGEVKSARVTRSVEKTFDLHTSYEESGEYLTPRPLPRITATYISSCPWKLSSSAAAISSTGTALPQA